MSHTYEKLRNEAGLIDLVDWVRFEITGPQAADALDSIVGGNVADLYEGKAMNTLVPSLDGGIEAILWLLATRDGYLVIAEPEEEDAIHGLLAGLASDFDITVKDRCGTLFHMVLTGPKAEAIASAALGNDISSIPFLSTFGLANDILAVRIGFFGEYELHLLGENDAQATMIDALQGASDHPLATDSSAFPVMMAEMRILNRARDIPNDVSVFEAGVQWMIDFQKPNLRAADALAARRDTPKRNAVLMSFDAAPVAAQTPIIVENETIGTVQSAYHSATLGQTVALAFLDADLAVPGLVLQTSAGLGHTLSAPAFLSKSVLNALGRAA
jgi:aminomethyltransferase